MPQIEWQVREDNSEQTIVKTPSTSARRWRLSLIALMIVLGVGLGAIYSSIKEPAPRPTSAPTITPNPTPIPATEMPSLDATIDREAQALADGDFKTFLSLQDQSDGPWYQSQVRNFRAWGRPPRDDQHFDSPYSYKKFQPEPFMTDRIWVDIRQYRNGTYFYEARLYFNVNGQWSHTRPDASFWWGQYRSLQSQHFDILYPLEDSNLISSVEDRFETAYVQVCADLNCSIDSTRIQIHISPFVQQPDWTNFDFPYIIVLPSPRITGMFDTNDAAMLNQRDDPVMHIAYESLTSHLVQDLSGGYTRWANGRGWFYMQAVEAWELNRVSAKPNMMQLLPPSSLASDVQLARLESLWDGQDVPSNPEQVANSVIFFIEQKYGPESVSKFLQATGPANSLAEAIKNSLGVDEIQFEQQWKDWLKQIYTQGS